MGFGLFPAPWITIFQRAWPLTSIAEIRRHRVRVSTQHLAVGAFHADGAGVVEAHPGAGLVLGQALHLEPHVVAIRVGLDEVGAVHEDGVQLNRVRGLRPDEARVRDEGLHVPGHLL